MVENPELKKAKDENKRVAQLQGHWVAEEFKKQEVSENIALMIMLAAKHGISYMQIWPDAVKEAIRTQVYDAFDILVKGDVQELDDSPFLIKAHPKTISEIKANELFDKTQLAKLSPDNKLASSEIKEAYLRAKQGIPNNPDLVATVIQKEAFIKEYLNDENRERIRSMNPELLSKRKDGDCVIRHAFVAGNIWLFDEYLDIYKYPFAEFRFEPGALYQVPLIERFIPANKSLDVVTSRVERYINTMVTGFWMKKQGEQFKPTNIAGGVVYEYLSTPPTQGNIQPIPGFVFNFMELLTNFIEEQGVTTSSMGKIPKGTRSNAAIESIKESEYASLAVAQRRTKKLVKNITQLFLQIADEHFVNPQSVQYLERGEPQYFNIAGKRAMAERKRLGVPVEGDTIPISAESRVDIEIEAGLGYTKAGKRENMLKLISEFLLPLSEKGLIPPAAVKTIIQRTLETFQFGATAELMDQLENPAPISDGDMEKMKVALLEVVKDLQGSGVLPDEQQRVDEGKMATLEVLNDTGLVDGKPTDPMVEIEIQAKQEEMRQKQEKHELEMQKLRQEIQNVDEKVDTELDIKKTQARQDMIIKEEQSNAQIELKKKQAAAAAKVKGATSEKSS